MGRLMLAAVVPLARERGGSGTNRWGLAGEARSHCLEHLPAIGTLNGIAFNPHNTPTREVF